MTDKQQPEALRLADALEEPLHDFPEPTTLEAEAAAELRRQHAELETLRTGYAAARLEIESLKAQLAERASQGQAPAQAAPTTQPAPQQDVSAAGGDSFLLLPTRPTPDAPANTAGLSWDAYSGAQMLAYGRSCSDAALVVAAPSPASHGDTTDIVDVPDQCPYFGPSPHRDVWLEGWHAACATQPAPASQWDALLAATSIALEVLQKHRQMKGDWPMGELGRRAAEELQAARYAIFNTAHAAQEGKSHDN